jgi:hypothetical protein
MQKTGIQRRHEPADWVLHEPNSRVAKRADDIDRSIHRGVVDHDHFQRRIGLAQHRFERLAHPRLRIAHRQQHRNERQRRLR